MPVGALPSPGPLAQVIIISDDQIDVFLWGRSHRIIDLATTWNVLSLEMLSGVFDYLRRRGVEDLLQPFSLEKPKWGLFGYASFFFMTWDLCVNFLCPRFPLYCFLLRISFLSRHARSRTGREPTSYGRPQCNQFRHKNAVWLNLWFKTLGGVRLLLCDCRVGDLGLRQLAGGVAAAV